LERLLCVFKKTIDRLNPKVVNIPESESPRVVIIGGGFGGLQLSKALRNKPFQVVLLDRQNYHAFQPLLYQVATAGLESGSIAYPFRKIFNHYENYFFRMAEVLEVDTKEKKVKADIGELSYDYLVIATGATSNFFGIKSVEQNAMPMKSVADALDIRSLMLQNLEKALLRNNLDEKESLMSIIIVGGGPTGVELAGAIAELKKDILPKDYPDMNLNDMDIHLVDANARVLKEMNEKSSEHALKTLQKMGVEIHLNTRVTDYDGYKATTKDGQELRGSTMIWAAGVMANVPPGIDAGSIVNGRISVNEFNQVQGFENIFALGDVARMSSTEYPEGHPMMAQPAMQQGKLLASNLVKLSRGEKPVAFHYKNLGSMATIGRAQAVAELPKLRLTGWMAWITWLVVHIFQLIGFRNKLVVFLHWAQNYLRHSRDLRLIIRPFRSKH
jgi:NADH:ubiquinone reductase (H+-translocating)